MLEGLVIGLIIGIVAVGINLTIAATRRGSSVIGTKPRRLQTFTVQADPQQALEEVIHFAQQAGYKISAKDEAKGQLVLEESASAMSWGFFFPIFITRQPDDVTLVEVGIKSKLLQVGPIVTRSHEKCVNGIKATLLAPVT